MDKITHKEIYNTIKIESLNNEKENNTDLNTTSNYSKNNYNNLPLIDELINSNGYSIFHFKIIFFTAFIIFIDGVHMSLLSSTYIPFQNYYNLSDTQMSVISSTMFIAIGLGSFLTLFPNIIGIRKSAIIKFTVLLFLFNFLLGIITNLFLFIVFRLLIGVCIGVLLPLINNLLVEVLPIKNRSFSMIVTSLAFNLGAIFLNLVILFIMPNYEKEQIFLVYLVVSFPTLISGIIFYFYLEESPRTLILNNNEDDGFKILEKMIGKSISQKEKDLIKFQIKSGSNKNVESKLSSIFEYKFKLITIILIFIWMFNSYLAYGGSITLSLTLKRLEEINKNKNNNSVTKIENYSDIIKSQILVYFMSTPGSLIAAFMSEIKFFGRKMTTFIGFLFIGFFATLAVFDIDNFAIYFGLSGSFISLSFSASNSYSCEVYPTKIRDLAVGFLYFCTRISGFISQFAAVQLFKLHYLGQIYMTILICILACFVTYMLPYDTHGKALDSDEEDHNNIKSNFKIKKINSEINIQLKDEDDESKI